MEYQQHIEHISALSRPGGPLAADGPSATIKNRAWFRRLPAGQYRATAARARLHDHLLEAERNVTPNVQQQRKAIVLAGPPGAGKSTVLKQLLGTEEQHYRVLDADNFKAALLETALQDGSYEHWLKPAAVKQLESEGAQFYPLDLASLVHEESSMLMKTLRDESMQRGDNIVIDAVLSDPTKAQDLGEQLQHAGYSIEVVDVEVPFEVSQQRIQHRWLHARQQAEQSSSGLGGRWVPSEFAREVFHGPDGRTKPEFAARQLAEQCGAVRRYRLFRTTADMAVNDVGPRMELDRSRVSQKASLVDTSVAAIRERSRSFRPSTGPHQPTHDHDQGFEK